MDDVLQKYHRRVVESDAERMHRVEAQENVLILFRQFHLEIIVSCGLRVLTSSRETEGRHIFSKASRPVCIGRCVISTVLIHCSKEFPLQVYETSLFLAIIFESPRHASVIIPHLVPDLYLPCSEHSQHVTFTILASSVHHLLAQYPSQGLFHQHLDSIPHQLFPKDSKARKWLTSLASCLRKRQYAMFERESRRSTILRVLCLQEEELGLSKHLGSLAVLVAVDSLRAKARETAWTVMRSAYRELACHVGSMDTRNWLERSLCLKSTISESFTIPLEQFLDQQSSLGAVRAKEGVEGRWIVCKIRS